MLIQIKMRIDFLNTLNKFPNSLKGIKNIRLSPHFDLLIAIIQSLLISQKTISIFSFLNGPDQFLNFVKISLSMGESS
ncbi:hypothetical protein Pelsub_P1781 [Pelolinea submarina]|nr:hypothetical protein Pelsub_P1781 [Pelolinea submarina]